MSEIGWKDGSFVGSKDTVIGATVHGLGGEVKGADTVPFVCAFSGETKSGTKTGGSNVFASLQLTNGDSFSINFGDLNHTGGITKGGGIIGGGIDYAPSYTAFDYKTTVSGIGGLKDGGSKVQLEWVTDFNLDLTATDAKDGQVLFQDFLGVQVISGEDALSGKDQFFFDNGQLVFDPIYSGDTKVDLFSTPIQSPVPEPGSLALIATGLLGLAAGARRRKKDNAGGGEPEA